MTTNSVPVTDENGKLREIHLPEHLTQDNLDEAIDPVALFEQAMED